MKRDAASRRRPGATPSTPSRTQRSRAASPTRLAATTRDDQAGRHTTLTARAAILMLAVAAVIVAVALPFKIWLGQRGDIASLQAQTHHTELKLGRLNAQDKRWQEPSYIESQARQRLHYVLPGQTTHIVLGRSDHTGRTKAAGHEPTVTTGPWYSQFWKSVQVAGDGTAAKSGHTD